MTVSKDRIAEQQHMLSAAGGIVYSLGLRCERSEMSAAVSGVVRHPLLRRVPRAGATSPVGVLAIFEAGHRVVGEG